MYNLYSQINLRELSVTLTEFNLIIVYTKAISHIKESLTDEVIINFCDTDQRFHMSTNRAITRIVCTD